MNYKAKKWVHSRKVILYYTWVAFAYGPLSGKKNRWQFALDTYISKRTTWNRLYRYSCGNPPTLRDFFSL